MEGGGEIRARRLGAGPAAVERWIGRTYLAAALAFLAAAALLAVTLPYAGWDPYAYGAWSRLIGLHGGFHFAEIGASDLHRPLFYVLQGELWRVTGYHLALGRLLSLAFAVVLVAAVGRLAAWQPHAALRRAVAVLVALLVTDVAVHASDGLTDVPAAATVAVAAVVLWTVRDSRVRPALLAAAALLAVLAKPSGLVGVAALALAQLVGDRAALRRRVVRDVLPLAGGLLIGLGYDWSQALHEDMSLTAFLQSGVSSGIWVERAAAARPDAVYGWRWLGEPLHVALVFAVAYAVLRVGGARHRIAAALAVPAAWLWAFLGPSLADHPYRPGLDSTGVATYVLAASLALAALAPESAAPSRLQLGRLLVWAAPAVLIWIRYAAYDTRLVSAAWPPLILLAAAALTTTLVGAARRAPLLAAVPAAALLWLALNNVYELNGLGRDGWRQYTSRGLAGLRDPELMENVALGQFQQELAAVRAHAGPEGRIVGGDARLGFFFPGRVDYDYPSSCTELAGSRVFVLLLSDESVAAAHEEGAPATESDWAACKEPRLTPVASEPSVYSVFAVG